MLDLVCVFRKTGAQLWSKSWVPGALKGNPVDALIHHVLLEVRALVIARTAQPFWPLRQLTRS